MSGAALEYPNNFPLKLAFLLFISVLVFERILTTFNKKKIKAIRKFQPNVLWVVLSIYLLIFIICVVGFLFKENINLIFVGVGCFILFVGIAIRNLAIRELGDYWSIFTVVKEGQKFVNTGIYGYLKHPYYLAVIFELMGLSILGHSWTGLVLTFFVQLPLLVLRSNAEDRIRSVYTKRLKI